MIYVHLTTEETRNSWRITREEWGILCTCSSQKSPRTHARSNRSMADHFQHLL